MRHIVNSSLLLAAASAYVNAEPVVLKVAHFWPPTAMSQQKLLQPWCDKIARESAGELKCQIYPANQLGGTPPQLIQQVSDGIADVAWTVPGYTAGRFPSIEVFELPFMTNRAEAASRAAWDYYLKYGQKDFAAVKPLAFHVHDEGYVHNNKHPIKALADFRGLKLRAPTRMSNKMLAAFGATPVSLPLPTLGDAVSKGVVDGYVLPWEVIPTLKLHEMTKYHSETDGKVPALYTTTFVFAMNKARYDSLPAKLQKVIDANSGAALSAQMGKAWDDSAVGARQQAQARGNAFNTVPAAELAAWRKLGEQLAEGWAEEVSGKGYPGKAMLNDARALIARYNAQ